MIWIVSAGVKHHNGWYAVDFNLCHRCPKPRHNPCYIYAEVSQPYVVRMNSKSVNCSLGKDL